LRDFHLPGRSPVFAENGICATSHPLAAHTAIDILKSGGNAMDAAIGAAVLLGICEPQMTGLGGDCFVLWSRHGHSVQALNGSGRAPAALHAADLRANGHHTVPLHGPEAVTLPGAVDAFCHLSEAEGKLGLDRILAPAIHYADAGVPVAPRTAFDWEKDAAVLQGTARDAYLVNGSVPKPGAVFRAPKQAEVLRKIAKEGRAGFYEGDVAEDMCNTLRARGGVHTLEDYAAVACTPTTPIQGQYGGKTLHEHPPNGQGATAILLLNILAQFDLASMDPFGAERLHLEAEATKLAYDARNRFVGDPDFADRLDYMTSMQTAEALAALIDPTKAMAAAAPLTEAIHKDTVYLTIVDRDQMAVSLIYSIFHGFGSGIASEKYGILFQNRGAGFTLAAGHPNELGGGKRPMHTIIPAILGDGTRSVMPFGVMGGQYQSTGHARVLTNMLDFGMDPQSALDAPRAFSDAGILKIERGYTPEVRQTLSDLGHSVDVPDTPLGGAQAIYMHDSGVLEGASDPRKDGCAIGY